MCALLRNGRACAAVQRTTHDPKKDMTKLIDVTLNRKIGLAGAKQLRSQSFDQLSEFLFVAVQIAAQTNVIPKK